MSIAVSFTSSNIHVKMQHVIVFRYSDVIRGFTVYTTLGGIKANFDMPASKAPHRRKVPFTKISRQVSYLSLVWPRRLTKMTTSSPLVMNSVTCGGGEQLSSAPNFLYFDTRIVRVKI